MMIKREYFAVRCLLKPLGGLGIDAPPACTETSSEALAQVAELQDSLRVLASHVVSRADTVVPAQLNSPLRAASLDEAAALLTVATEEFLQDAGLLGRLYGAVANLTALAAPASIQSIRLTRAFVHGSSDDPTLQPVADQARRLLRWAWASATFGVGIFLCAIVLLVHVDRGRRAIQQLEIVRTEYQTAVDSITVARIAGSVGSIDAPAPGCPPAGGPGDPIPRAANTRQERTLCANLQMAETRMQVVRHELRIWNAISHRLSYVSPIVWLSPPAEPLSEAAQDDWESSELRTAVMMAALTGFVMPMLLGLLGACVYVYREIDDQIRTSTLEARQSVHGTLRMLLGAILGGMLGAIWTNGQIVRLEGVSLSLGALAFFVGFSVEIVFSAIDALVRTLAGRVASRPV